MLTEMAWGVATSPISSEPPEPPGTGLFFELGSATGSPGETVEVPVLVSWDPEFRGALHTLAVEYDPSAIVVSAADLSVEALSRCSNPCSKSS